MKRLCVFCGANPGLDPVYRNAARDLGTALAEAGVGLVFGGGSVGLMGTIADAVLEAKGEVIGVIPQALVDRELAHRRVADLRIVSSMHERKALMADLSDGFVALPGGVGTLEELFEIWTWAHLGLHAKPCALLNSQGSIRVSDASSTTSRARASCAAACATCCSSNAILPRCSPRCAPIGRRRYRCD